MYKMSGLDKATFEVPCSFKSVMSDAYSEVTPPSRSVKVLDIEPEDLGSNSISDICTLCDLRQVNDLTSPGLCLLDLMVPLGPPSSPSMFL